nr:MAG TPA: hypothetical protein [Caudoviricetes sp.]
MLQVKIVQRISCQIRIKNGQKLQNKLLILLLVRRHIFNNIKVLGMSVELVKIIADISGYCV